MELAFDEILCTAMRSQILVAPPPFLGDKTTMMTPGHLKLFCTSWCKWDQAVNAFFGSMRKSKTDQPSNPPFSWDMLSSVVKLRRGNRLPLGQLFAGPFNKVLSILASVGNNNSGQPAPACQPNTSCVPLSVSKRNMFVESDEALQIGMRLTNSVQTISKLACVELTAIIQQNGDDCMCPSNNFAYKVPRRRNPSAGNICFNTADSVKLWPPILTTNCT